MSVAGFGVPNGGGGFAFKVDPNGNVKVGNDASDDLQITGSLHLSGSGGVTGTFQFNDNVFVLENGRVGLGVADPNYKLSVGGSMEVGQYIYHRGDTDTFIQFTTDDINIQAGGVNFIDITQGGTNEITFNEAGADIDFRVEGDTETHLLFVEGGTDRVGIGTSSPATTLHVADTDGRVRAEATAGNHPGFEFAVAGTRKWIIYNDPDNSDNLEIKTDSNVRMVIEQDGNVGIGTQSPDYTLDVAGNIGVDEYIYHNDDADTFMRFEDDSITFQAGNQELLTLTEATQDEVVVNENNNDVDFRVESSYATHMFYIDGANHRIGVGTNSPQSVLHIVDPLDGTGVERDAVIIMKSKKETGIKLIADSSNDNSGGEENNPFVDFYQDGQSDASGRGQRNASIAMEGPTGTTFTGSLANAFFMDAHVPNSPHSNRPLQLASDSTNGGHAARITLEGTNGYVGIHTNAPTTPLEVSGNTKVVGTTTSQFYVTQVKEQDLGSGTSSTLTVASGTILLDADSINGTESFGMEIHNLTFPRGSDSGTRLSLIVKTNTNNVHILPVGLISGSFDSLNNNAGVTATEYVWISEGTHQAWHQVK